MPAKVILIGLDAVEPTVFGDMIDSAPGAWRQRTAGGRLVGHSDFLTDTVWPEIRSGMSASNSGLYFQTKQIRGAEGRPRPLAPGELAPERFYWNVAAANGRRVAAIDQPLSAALPAAGAFELAEWGTHDRPGFPARPADPEVRRIIASRGVYPVTSCDRINDGLAEGRARLLGALRRGAVTKASLVGDILDAAEWDLFSAVLAEGHCAGHHFWPVDDNPAQGEVEAVYSDLATAVTATIERAGGDATVIVFSSHGMGPADYGRRLVPAVLGRLGLTAVSNPARRRVAEMLPVGWRRSLTRLAGPGMFARMGLTSRWNLDRPGSSAIPLPNSRHGAIRLSLKGRDDDGVLTAGSEAHRTVLDKIESGFTSLTAADGGHRVVKDVLLVDDILGAERHPDLPDVIVRFREDVGIIGDCRSEMLGPLRVDLGSARTGEHGTPGAIWAFGPGVEPGTHLGDVRTVDIAPTVLSLLDIPLPDWVDGRPVPGIGSI